MTPELAAFSDWVITLLPRLFEYPGGLWLLLSLLVLRAVRDGVRAVSPRALLSDLADVNLLSVAVAWAAISLAPLPGASVLPFPVDRFVLAALPLLSLLLDITDKPERVWQQASIGATITLALLLPALESRTLQPTATGVTFTLIASLLSVALGLLALSWQGISGMAGDVRWLAWLGLGIATGWQVFPVESAGGAAMWVAGLSFLLAVAALNIKPRRPQPSERAALWLTLIAPLPALLGLLELLLASR